ncbi:hypothetical protein [Ponticaulis profundi]|uniref:Phage portal protein n=1 Tax=Ponticaulis profundi TaxID=2665222 RepID=A0ABW1S8P6_9PROT
MKHSEIKAMAESVAPIVSDLLAKTTASFKAHSDAMAARLDALEKRLDTLPTPVDGRDADPEAVAAIVQERIKSELAEIRGAVESIEPPVLEAPELPDIPALVEEAVKAFPAPKDGEPGRDGKSVSIDDVLPVIKEQVDEYLKSIPAPENGKDGRDGADGGSVEIDDVLPQLIERADEFLKAIPAPKDGKDGRDGSDGQSVTLDDVKPILDEAVKRSVENLPRVASCLVDRQGELIVTYSNGDTKSLGVVVGRDGCNGADGKDGADGEPGKDGRDGLGFEDLDFEEKDGRLYAVFRRGDIVKEARIPGLSYRGVWKTGEYLKGDSVTFGACQWIANDDTTDKPGDGKGWQLAVRKGRDGRDAPKGESK